MSLSRNIAVAFLPLALTFSAQNICAQDNVDTHLTQSIEHPDIIDITPERASALYYDLREQHPFDDWLAANSEYNEKTDEAHNAYYAFLTTQFQLYLQNMFEQQGYPKLNAEIIGFGFAHYLYKLEGFIEDDPTLALRRVALFIPGLQSHFNGSTPAVAHTHRMKEYKDHHEPIPSICLAAIPETTYDMLSIAQHTTRQPIAEHLKQNEHFDTLFNRFTYHHEIAHCYGMDETQADYYGALQLLREAKETGIEHQARQLIEFTAAMRLHRLYNVFTLTGYRDRFQPFSLLKAIEIYDQGAIDGLTQNDIWSLPTFDPSSVGDLTKDDIMIMLAPLNRLLDTSYTPENMSYPFNIIESDDQAALILDQP